MKFSLLILPIVFEITGPCAPSPLLKKLVSSDSTNVGDLTVEVLTKNKIPYIGGSQGIRSIYETPTDLRSLEIISDIEMRAYGWCYEVDGKITEVYPNDASLSGVKRVRWFYGFAHFLEGEWVSQCEEAWRVSPKFLCQ